MKTKYNSQKLTFPHHVYSGSVLRRTSAVGRISLLHCRGKIHVTQCCSSLTDQEVERAQSYHTLSAIPLCLNGAINIKVVHVLHTLLELPPDNQKHRRQNYQQSKTLHPSIQHIVTIRQALRMILHGRHPTKESPWNKHVAYPTWSQGRCAYQASFMSTSALYCKYPPATMPKFFSCDYPFFDTYVRPLKNRV